MSQTLLEWFKREKFDGGQPDGLTSSERECIKALKREAKELRRPNEILKPTGTCFCSDGA